MGINGQSSLPFRWYIPSLCFLYASLLRQAAYCSYDHINNSSEVIDCSGAVLPHTHGLKSIHRTALTYVSDPDSLYLISYFNTKQNL